MATAVKRTSAKVKIKTKRRYGETASMQKSIESEADKIAFDFANGVARTYRRRVHVWPTSPEGEHLYQNVIVEPPERDGGGSYKVIVNKEHGVYEEYGTRYRPAHPAFRPAVEIERVVFKRRFGRLFNSVHR